jgi:hypothetical protein
MATSLLTAEMPLAEKVDVLQHFLGERYFHASGMMYSHWHWGADGLRPYRDSDFAGQSVPQTSAGFSPAGYISGENSPWVSGLFLWSQCLRFRATGDEGALQYAARAFHSIDTIARLWEAAGQPGFLCKPYDWKLSHETSPDQYVATMCGLPWPIGGVSATIRLPTLSGASPSSMTPIMPQQWHT